MVVIYFQPDVRINLPGIVRATWNQIGKMKAAALISGEMLAFIHEKI